MSDRVKSNVVLSVIVAFGCAVPVYFGAVECRPAVWEGDIIFEKIEKQRPKLIRNEHRKVYISAEDMNR